MDKEAALAKVNESEGDIQVFTKPEYDMFLKNYEDTTIEQKIKSRLSEQHTAYDRIVESVSGVKRNQDEKSYDYTKRIMSDLHQSVKDKEDKVSELEKAVNDKSGGEALELAKSELESMKTKHQSALDDWKQEREKMEDGTLSLRISNEFDRAMTGFKFKDAAIIPEDVRNAMINNAKAELSKIASFVEGELVFLNSDGTIMRDEKLNVLSAKEVLADKLKSVIDAGRKQLGLDIKDPVIEKDEDGKVIVTIALPSTVKTNEDLSNHLLSLGMKSGSEEYRAAYAKYIDKVKKVT